MSFLYSDSSTSDNTSHLVDNFFWANFVGLVLKSYMSHCLLYNEAAVLEFSYKTISIAHFLGNTHKCDYTKISGVRSGIDVIELLLYVGRTIIVFVTYYSCLWVS